MYLILAGDSLVYSDFGDDRGSVTRGQSMLQLPVSPDTYLDSAVRVLYLPGTTQWLAGRFVLAGIPGGAAGVRKNGTDTAHQGHR